MLSAAVVLYRENLFVIFPVYLSLDGALLAITEVQCNLDYLWAKSSATKRAVLVCEWVMEVNDSSLLFCERFFANFFALVSFANIHILVSGGKGR